MRRITLAISGLMALSLAMAACGTGAAPTPTVTPEPNPMEATTPSPTEKAPETAPPPAPAPETAPTPNPTPETAPESVKYTLSASATPAKGGHVSISSGQYEQGTRVEVTAVSSPGYTFDHWSGDASGESALIVISMDSDKDLVAHFADKTPPVISNVATSGVTDTKITIKWDTNEPATSQIEYGLDSTYGSISSLDKQLVLSHSVTISGLKPNTGYHFRIKSVDESGNEALLGDESFSTKYAWMAVSSSIYAEGNELFYILTNDSSEKITVTKVELIDQDGIIRHLDQSETLGVANIGQLLPGDALRKSFSSPGYVSFKGWSVKWYGIDEHLVRFTVSNSIPQ